MSHWYRRNGQRYRDNEPAIGSPAWQAMMQEVEKDLTNMDTKLVARDELPDGKVVSTVWLGFDHNYSDGPPLIFETMVFPSEGDWDEIAVDRYSTEQEAMEGHRSLVAQYSSQEAGGA